MTLSWRCPTKGCRLGVLQHTPQTIHEHVAPFGAQAVGTLVLWRMSLLGTKHDDKKRKKK